MSKGRRLLLALALTLPSVVFAATVPTGPVFRVNTVRGAAEPAVAGSASGGFVVVWSASGIQGQRLDGVGARIGPPFVVTTSLSSPRMRLAVAPSGSFVVVWESSDGSQSGIYARRLDASGSPQGPEFLVNTTTLGDQEDPAVAADGAGNYVIAWSTRFGDTFFRRYDAAGVPLSGEVMVTAGGVTPTVAADAAGNFVVVWQGTGVRAQARRFDATGTPLGPSFEVTSDTAWQSHTPTVASRPGGGFVVTWIRYDLNFNEVGIASRIFDASGAPLTADIFVDPGADDYLSSTPSLPTAAVDAADDFVITWERANAIYVARLESDGTPQGPVTSINRYALSERDRPSVGANGPAGGFLVAWHDVVGGDVVAQRFAPDCGDGTVGGGEACDDGNLADGDGCRSTCETEACFACAGSPSTCTPITVCASGDGCCLPGCSSTTDADCPTLISGNALLIKDFDDGRIPDQLSFRSRDGAIDTTAGSGIDPIADGATLHIHSASGGNYTVCRDLPASLWSNKRPSATGPVFAYDDPTPLACKLVRVRDGRLLRIKCLGSSGRPYPIGDPLGSVAVRFTSGDTEYCAVFGGQVRNDGPQQFSAVRADAPNFCPAPALPCPRVIPLGP